MNSKKKFELAILLLQSGFFIVHFEIRKKASYIDAFFSYLTGNEIVNVVPLQLLVAEIIPP